MWWEIVQTVSAARNCWNLFRLVQTQNNRVFNNNNHNEMLADEFLLTMLAALSSENGGSDIVLHSEIIMPHPAGYLTEVLVRVPASLKSSSLNCDVCWEPLLSNEFAYQTPCCSTTSSKKHLHQTCATKSLEISSKCPFCRYPALRV
jgi:hypothetical protein